MLINFYMRLDTGEDTKTKSEKNNVQGIKRVRVNDNTASGGWF